MSKKSASYVNRFSKAKQMQALLVMHLNEVYMGRKIFTEYKFKPGRQFAFDVAVLDYEEPEKIACEIEGGAWVQGAHNRGKHFISDMEKYNLAAAMGWKVFRFTPQQVEKGEAIAWLKEHMS